MTVGGTRLSYAYRYVTAVYALLYVGSGLLSVMNENPTPTGEVRVGETIFTNDRLEAHSASTYMCSGLVQLYIRTTDWLRTSYVSTSY